MEELREDIRKAMLIFCDFLNTYKGFATARFDFMLEDFMQSKEFYEFADKFKRLKENEINLKLDEILHHVKQ